MGKKWWLNVLDVLTPVDNTSFSGFFASHPTPRMTSLREKETKHFYHLGSHQMNYWQFLATWKTIFGLQKMDGH